MRLGALDPRGCSTMPLRSIRVRRASRWLEWTLWVAGCCALGYSGFSIIEAALTQAALTRSFDKSRVTRDGSSVDAALDGRLEHSGPAQPGVRHELRLQIASVGLSAMVLEGVKSGTLRVGLGHVPGTSWPGEPGNVVIAGHRDTFFRPLRKIKICDEISLDTPDRTYHYQVNSIEVVDPHEVSALRFHNKDELTLISCYPFFYVGPAPKRFVVHAGPVPVPGKCRLSSSVESGCSVSSGRGAKSFCRSGR